MPIMPERMLTERLVLRCYSKPDAPNLKLAIDGSLAHLRRWMPWAMNEPSEVPTIESRIADFQADFRAGRRWQFGMFLRSDVGESVVLGGIGLHPMAVIGGVDLGYWLRPEMTGHGFVTEAASALVRHVLTQSDIDCVEIYCDPANVRSAAVPQRLGFHHVETRKHDAITPTGAPRDSMVWRFTSADLTE